MQYSYLQVFRSPKTGKYRVMIVGQPDNHIMDWRGCNFRRMAMATPLKKTFNKAQQAFDYAKELEAGGEDRFIHFAKMCGDGSYIDQREFVSEPTGMPDAPSEGYVINVCKKCSKQFQAFSKTCGYCGGEVERLLEPDKNKVIG